MRQYLAVMTSLQWAWNSSHLHATARRIKDSLSQVTLGDSESWNLLSNSIAHNQALVLFEQTTVFVLEIKRGRSTPAMCCIFDKSKPDLFEISCIFKEICRQKGLDLFSACCFTTTMQHRTIGCYITQYTAIWSCTWFTEIWYDISWVDRIQHLMTGRDMSLSSIKCVWIKPSCWVWWRLDPQLVCPLSSLYADQIKIKPHFFIHSAF